ncbi:MAG: ABC transporter substrate-binding protein [Planctomycetota bacterium]|jgi:ABC-type branched-subunit amino acid transport system substrate-binding protein
MKIHRFLLPVLFLLSATLSGQEEAIPIGLIIPQTGHFASMGLDQIRGAELALEEINRAGGVLGRPLKLIPADTASTPHLAAQRAQELIRNQKVHMLLGGVSSAVAVAMGKICQEQRRIFMATISSANATTREEGHRHTFRAAYNARMCAKAFSTYLNRYHSGRRYLYVVTNYTWGWSMEENIRRFTGTEDHEAHKEILIPPGAPEAEHRKVLRLVPLLKPDVLILALSGRDLSIAIRLCHEMGIKAKTQVTAPILVLGLAEAAGAKAMAGVIGTSDWNYQVPLRFNFPRGSQFVKSFAERHQRYPGWGAATAYTNLHQYAEAVKRAGSLDSAKVIPALEGHRFTLLKDEQQWRRFDHQCVQSIYLVQGRAPQDVLNDPYHLDYFNILYRVDSEEVIQPVEEWIQSRRAAGRETSLEPLPGEEGL